MSRLARIERTSTETKIKIELNLDGSGQFKVHTSIPFLDHMLSALAKHSAVDLSLTASGDTHIDDHHTVEDIGICLGDAYKEALGDRKGIVRYGHFSLAMEEALVDAAVDISGRPFLVYNVGFAQAELNGFSLDLLEEFWRAFCNRLGLNLHIHLRLGKNAHHICEASFKAVARAMRMAMSRDERLTDIPSTKGLLD